MTRGAPVAAAPGAIGAAAGTAAVAVLAALVLGGCAKRLPPPGGKLGNVAPRVLAIQPDSGATSVSLRPEITVTFSESMDERTTNDRLLLSPFVRTARVRWRGKTASVELADSLAPATTYTVLVGGRATDVRGIVLGAPRFSHFTTGAAFPRGRISGRVEAIGHPASNLYVWAYRADLGHAPDSTARDYDALAQTDREGRYELPPLDVPSRWKLFAFHDANGTLTFEPGIDHLTAREEEIELSEAAASADSIRVRSLDPAAPAEVRGTVAETAGLLGESVRLVALSDTASMRTEGELAPSRRGAPVRRSEIAVTPPEFVMELAAGRYLLWLYLDRNGNRRLDAGEPEGESQRIEVRAGDRITGISLAPPGVQP